MTALMEEMDKGLMVVRARDVEGIEIEEEKVRVKAKEVASPNTFTRDWSKGWRPVRPWSTETMSKISGTGRQ